jgi:hypothetical protein
VGLKSRQNRRIDMGGVNLEQHEAHLQRLDGEVEKAEGEVVQVGRSILNKAVVLQTIALIVTLIGLAIAAERRITTIEVKTSIETQARVDQERAMLEAIQKLQDQTRALSESQVRVVTILDEMNRRLALEDARRVAASKKE